MAIELVRRTEPQPNAELVQMLRQVLALVESGDVQGAAVAYVIDGVPVVCYDAEGYEAEISCAARQIDDEMRQVIFDGE